jgi:HEPN domain-containing protein
MNFSEAVNRWCQKAENDFKNANHEIEHDDPALDTVCFHAQQTVEKYLKEFLVFSRKEIPKTHILIRLIKECISVDPTFSELLDLDIDELTEYAVEIRYADDFVMLDRAEARNAIEKAEFVKNFVLAKISPII